VFPEQHSAQTTLLVLGREVTQTFGGLWGLPRALETDLGGSVFVAQIHPQCFASFGCPRAPGDVTHQVGTPQPVWSPQTVFKVDLWGIVQWFFAVHVP